MLSFNCPLLWKHERLEAFILKNMLYKQSISTTAVILLNIFSHHIMSLFHCTLTLLTYQQHAGYYNEMKMTYMYLVTRETIDIHYDIF